MIVVASLSHDDERENLCFVETLSVEVVSEGCVNSAKMEGFGEFAYGWRVDKLVIKVD